jgi:hypothetical protein
MAHSKYHPNNSPERRQKNNENSVRKAGVPAKFKPNTFQKFIKNVTCQPVKQSMKRKEQITEFVALHKK